MSRRRNKHWHTSRDGNEPDVVRELEDAGAVVIPITSTSVSGCPDLLVGIGGRWCVAEVKQPGETLKPAQAGFRELCRRHGLPWFLLDHIDDTLTLIEELIGYDYDGSPAG